MITSSWMVVGLVEAALEREEVSRMPFVDWAMALDIS